tara:strand:+ start:7310 stop:7978 length:669 start_codon:yes stop_codon:yes gene_type:complete
MVRLLEQSTTSATDLISVATAKEFLRVTHSEDDTLIGSLIAAGVESAQNFTNMRFLSAVYVMYLESWTDVYVSNTYDGYLYRDVATSLNTTQGGYYSPYTGLAQFVMPYPPLSRITTIQYYDTSNVQQTLSASDYNVFTFTNQKGFAEITKDIDLPDVYDRADAIEINFTAGFGTTGSDVPDAIKQAILLIVGHLYEKREDTVSRLPKASEYLLEPYRIKTY